MRLFKRFGFYVGGVFLSLASAMPLYGSVQPQKQKIVISQIVEHPALNAVRDALLSKLEKAGYGTQKPLEVLYKNAQGNIQTVAQISAQFANEDPKPDVFIAIGTPTAQSALAAVRGKQIPIVFAAVTDPKASRLVRSLEQPGGSITGVVDFPPLSDELKLMRAFLPQLKKIGFLYHSGEENSVATIARFKELLKGENIELEEALINNPADLSLAFKTLEAKGVDAVYIPQDNMVIAAMGQVTSLALEARLPVFTSDNGSVAEGALASVSYAYADVGEKAADYVIKLLEGVSVTDLKIAPPEKSLTYINAKTMKVLGLSSSKITGDGLVIYEDAS